MNKERKRHWYIVRKKGSDKIHCLFSAYSFDHLRRKAGLKGVKDIVIQEARRWHISRVFSGVPIFYDYKLQQGKWRNMGVTEGVEECVPNEFHTEMDGEKILVKILS